MPKTVYFIVHPEGITTQAALLAAMKEAKKLRMQYTSPKAVAVYEGKLLESA